jgi:predicted RNA-binding Zn-ribbon protein involved in translation (DUF1610 family)
MDAPAAATETLCAFCQCPVGEGEQATSCPSCRAPYHAACWEENGGCALYGCELAPKVGMRSGIEIPASYWGQENKPCPACGAEILAAAVRCRHCGATFDSARPQDAGEFAMRAEQKQAAPAMRGKAVWLFIFCVLPPTAPIAAIVTLFWWLSRRRQIEALPALYSGLVRLAMIVGFGQTILAVLAALAYTFLNHG